MATGPQSVIEQHNDPVTNKGNKMRRIKVTKALDFLKESSMTNPEIEKALLRFKTQFGDHLDVNTVEEARKRWASSENNPTGTRQANLLLDLMRAMITEKEGLKKTNTLFVDDVYEWHYNHRRSLTSAQWGGIKTALRAYKRYVGELILIDRLDNINWGRANYTKRSEAVYSTRIRGAVKNFMNHKTFSTPPAKPITIPAGGKSTSKLAPPPFDWTVLNVILNHKPKNDVERKTITDIRRCKNRANKAGGFGQLVAKTIDGKLKRGQEAYKRDVALTFTAYYLIKNQGTRVSYTEMHQECIAFLKQYHKDAPDFINRDHLALEVDRGLTNTSFGFQGVNDYTGRGKNKALHIWYGDENAEPENEPELVETKPMKATVDGQDINEVEYITELLQDLPGFRSCVSYEDVILVHLKDFWVTLAQDTHDILDIKVRASKVAGRPKNLTLRFGNQWVPWTDYAGTFRLPVNALKTEIWKRLGIETVEENGVVRPAIEEGGIEETVVVEAAPVVEEPEVVEEEPVTEPEPVAEQTNTLTLEGFMSFAKDYDASEFSVDLKGAVISKDLVAKLKEQIGQVKDKRRQVEDLVGTLVSSLDEVLVDLEAKEKALQNLLQL